MIDKIKTILNNENFDNLEKNFKDDILNDTGNKSQHHWLIYCQINKETNLYPEKWGSKIVKIVSQIADKAIPVINNNLKNILPQTAKD